MADDTDEFEDQAGKLQEVQEKRTSFSSPQTHQQPSEKLAVVRRASSISDVDRENALEVRKNALKNNGGTACCLSTKPPSFILLIVMMTPLPKRSTCRTSLALPSPSPALPPRRAFSHKSKSNVHSPTRMRILNEPY